MSRVEDILVNLWSVWGWCRCFKGATDGLVVEQMGSVELFDHLDIPRRSIFKRSIQCISFLRRSFFMNTVIKVYQF